MRQLTERSGTCRRFRRILLPRIYREVKLLRIRNQAKIVFFELMPKYGHLVHSLHIRIQEEQNGHLLRLLHDACSSLTSLKVLVLDIRLDPLSTNERDAMWGTPQISHLSSSTPMNHSQRTFWGALCMYLPRSLLELHLHGFTWSDAVHGLKQTSLPDLHCLALHLDADVPWPSTSSVFQNFPKVTDIAFPATWCPGPEWLQDVSRDRPLERLAIGLTDPDIDRFHPLEDSPEAHRCGAKKCPWKKSVRELLLAAAPTLTSFVFGTPSLLDVRLGTGSFTSLTSLHVNGISLHNKKSLLEKLFAPFLASPLVELTITQCGDIPIELASWFKPASKAKWPKHTQRGPRWPTLKKLTIDHLQTSVGPGDEDYESGNDLLPEDVCCWYSASRDGLEEYCRARGIDLEIEWRWFEGYG